MSGAAICMWCSHSWLHLITSTAIDKVPAQLTTRLEASTQMTKLQVWSIPALPYLLTLPALPYLLTLPALPDLLTLPYLT